MKPRLLSRYRGVRLSLARLFVIFGLLEHFSCFTSCSHLASLASLFTFRKLARSFARVSLSAFGLWQAPKQNHHNKKYSRQLDISTASNITAKQERDSEAISPTRSIAIFASRITPITTPTAFSAFSPLTITAQPAIMASHADAVLGQDVPVCKMIQVIEKSNPTSVPAPGNDQLLNAFVAPTLSAFTSRRSVVITSDDKSDDTFLNIPLPPSMANSNSASESFDPQTLLVKDTGCVIEDSDDENYILNPSKVPAHMSMGQILPERVVTELKAVNQDDKQASSSDDSNDIAVAGSDEDWEDEAGTSYNPDGTVIVKNAFTRRRQQLQKDSKYQRYLRSKKLHKIDSEPRLATSGSPISPARNADGSFISNLSLQIRRHKEETAARAASAPASISGSLVGGESSGIHSPGSSLAGSEVRERMPLINAMSGLPQVPGGLEFAPHQLPLPNNPLRCHPVAHITPPLTPPFPGDQSPNHPPPVPPSTPVTPPASVLLMPNMPRRRTPSVTPPMSPSTVMVALANAVSTRLSNHTALQDTDSDLASVKSASSSLAMIHASEAESMPGSPESVIDSKASTMPGTAPGTAPSTAPSTETSSADTAKTTESVYARFALMMGSFKPFASNTLKEVLELTGIGASHPDPNPNGLFMRPALKRSASSYLLGSEANAELRGHIAYENDSRHRFNYYGPPREAGSDEAGPSSAKNAGRAIAAILEQQEDACKTALSPSHMQRTQSEPSMSQADKGKQVKNGFRDQPEEEEVDLEEILYAGELYNVRYGYNTRGW